MGYFYFVVIILAIAVIATPFMAIVSGFETNPLVTTIILVIIIGIIVLLIRKKQKEKFIEKNYGIPEIDEDILQESSKFLDSFLSFCQKHTVDGFAYFSIGKHGENQYFIKRNYVAKFSRVDGLPASNALSTISECQRKMNSSWEEYKDASDAFNKCAGELFGWTTGHFVFFDDDNYTFSAPFVNIEYQNEFLPRASQYVPTFNATKRLLLGKYPKAAIEVHDDRIIVKGS